jgi:hypothetical protein
MIRSRGAYRSGGTRRPIHSLARLAAEVASIHRSIERLEEQGASNAGFAKKIDHALARIAAIEEHLGICRCRAARAGALAACCSYLGVRFMHLR